MSTVAIDPKATATATPAPSAANATAAAAPQAGVAPTGGVGSPTGAASAPAPAGGAVAAEPAARTAASPKFLLGEDQAPAEVKDGKPAEVDNAAAAKTADWKLTAPKDVTVDAETLTATEAFAKEHGLSQAQAEKLLGRDLAARTASETAAKTAETERSAKIAQQWFSEAENHPEIGGANLKGAVANAKRALQAFATAEERKAIAASPFANNPMFIAILNRAAAAIPTEDVVHASTAQVAKPALDPAKVLYGNV